MPGSARSPQDENRSEITHRFGKRGKVVGKRGFAKKKKSQNWRKDPGKSLITARSERNSPLRQKKSKSPKIKKKKGLR